MARVLSFLTISLLFSSVSFATELGKFKVITTFTVIADIAQNVAGDAGAQAVVTATSTLVPAVTTIHSSLHAKDPRAKDPQLREVNRLSTAEGTGHLCMHLCNLSPWPALQAKPLPSRSLRTWSH